VQLVQADVELPHDMRRDVHDQVRVQLAKHGFRAPPDAIIVELLDLFGCLAPVSSVCKNAEA
jgi:hypothetical protein